MARLWRCLLIGLALSAGPGPACAASSAENRAWNAAANALQIESWDIAEKKFAEFIQKYPRSERAPEAILFQAQARYHLKRYADAVGLLAAQQGRAGMWEDEYLYWTAQAHYRAGNYEAAAEAFARLARDFRVSPKGVEACVGEATALAQLGRWPLVAACLQETNGLFQLAAKSAPGSEFVVRGWLLLGEAFLAQTNPAAAATALESLGSRSLDPELGWRREYLRCRLQLAEGRLNQAADNATQLVSLANAMVQARLSTNAPPRAGASLQFNGGAQPAALLAQSWAFRAAALERLERFPEAIDAYTNNLSTNVPPAQTRQALLKIAGLYLALEDPESASRELENYLRQYPDSSAADMALLTLGELQLKQHVAGLETNAVDRATETTPPATNHLEQALSRFDALWSTYPDSPLAGNAQLGRGWCFWVEERYAQSLEAFRRAALSLPPFSTEQAVARFKWADAQFQLHDFAGAVSNYTFIITNFAAQPEVKRQLFERALYQTVLAALTNNVPAALDAMGRILDWYPDGFAGPRSLFLVGQGFGQGNDPARARELFLEFERRFPTNDLLPRVRLAVARTFEQQGDWAAAISRYNAWITNSTDPRELPRAEFSRAWDYYMAREETNAFVLFTNFVARYPASEYARQAQWWIGDHYFRQGAYLNAENIYQLVSSNTNWPPSKLTYQAQMMAGLAAVARLSYRDAITYFTNLADNPACPLDLRIRAGFACADALMSRTDSGATNRQADLEEAVDWLKAVLRLSATNALASSAWGMMGNCWLQLADLDPRFYDEAANAYQQAFTSPLAPVAARSEAGIGLGLVAEGRARLRTGEEQTALMKQALARYLEVFDSQSMLRDGEQPDLFWVKEAGLKAARVSEALRDWPQAIRIYQQMQDSFPQLRSTLENRILKAHKNLLSTGAN